MGCHFLLQCLKVKSESEVAQSCPIFRDPMDCSLPGSSIHGIFQARVLEWGAIAFSAANILGCFSCVILCDPMDCSLPGSSVPGILHARMGCCFIFQGIFLTHGSNPHFLHLLHSKVGSLTRVPPGKP